MTDLERAVKMLGKAMIGFRAIGTYAGVETKMNGFATMEQIRDFANSRASYINQLLKKL